MLHLLFLPDCWEYVQLKLHQLNTNNDNRIWNGTFCFTTTKLFCLLQAKFNYMDTKVQDLEREILNLRHTLKELMDDNKNFENQKNDRKLEGKINWISNIWFSSYWPIL